MVDVGSFVRRVQERFPIGSRSPANMALLYGATVDAWDAVLEQVRAAPVGVFAGGREQLRADMDAFVERMMAYREAIEQSETEEELTPKIRGFLVNFPGSGHTTPDFATPYTLHNQIAASRPAYDEHAYWDAIGEAVDEAPELVGEALGKTARQVGRVAGEAAGGFAIGLGFAGLAVGAGIVAMAIFLRGGRSTRR